ncbi:XRE family transcriptional regulator [Staphylococcus aureus]|uniref:XRE family transcriptional regulator n=1 Tax=Staphylococcus aureus TaxID=1280 RepID=UPI0018E9FBF4|nr:XRE family transcriptional regulator [Staphylococcus aureus]MBJ6292022.1 XRE family transcriptional regulator [Staphylococcus aureus]MBJ6293385.1 XRE family transcriptional regulator [Staphylococcus aureus]MBJ6296744.1 XRE family transcriptional regulator [Staphylococcus aureus]MBJ6306085.1 XRE family transcriptional regulator [Staphylococcus aureus]MBJ6313169.1 XRE family transcriptional regulator [Staphylococcus aureus]
MLIETVKKLINSNLSAYEIGKKTGVDPASIRRIRRGERTVEKLSFDSAEKLYNYQRSLENKEEDK